MHAKLHSLPRRTCISTSFDADSLILVGPSVPLDRTLEKSKSQGAGGGEPFNRHIIFIFKLPGSRRPGGRAMVKLVRESWSWGGRRLSRAILRDS